MDQNLEQVFESPAGRLEWLEGRLEVRLGSGVGLGVEPGQEGLRSIPLPRNDTTREPRFAPPARERRSRPAPRLGCAVVQAIAPAPSPTDRLPIPCAPRFTRAAEHLPHGRVLAIRREAFKLLRDRIEFNDGVRAPLGQPIPYPGRRPTPSTRSACRPAASIRATRAAHPAPASAVR